MMERLQVLFIGLVLLTPGDAVICLLMGERWNRQVLR